MIETSVEEVELASSADLLAYAADLHVQHKAIGCRKLEVAASWADHHPVPRRPEGGLAAERLVPGGPRGCPQIAETAPAELALVFQTSVGGAKSLIRDALNLRHRMPRIWQRIRAGEIHHWKARAIAQRSAHLNPVAAAEVDRLLANHIELVAWRRFEKMLDATLLHVDERTYRQRADQLATHRDVWATESSEGMRTLVARAAAGDVTIFLALVNRIAEALADDGDEDPLPARRAKAIGIAGYPDRALDLLLRHRNDPDLQRAPWEQAAEHERVRDHPTAPGGATDPWAEGAPAAGWQNAEYANYFQPDPDDADYRAGHDQVPDEAEEPGEPDIDADVVPEPGASDAVRYANTGGLNLPAALVVFGALSAEALSGARPKVVIHLHLTDEAVCSGRGVIRTAYGPITADQLRWFLGDMGCDVTVFPVLDPAQLAPVDGYEVPPRMRRAVETRHPASVFPFSPSTSRLDLDHTLAYRSGGPPGQTGVGKLGPLGRSEHRARTHGGWGVRQPAAGSFVWPSPQGLISLVTNQGTLLLGDSSFARQVGAPLDLPPCKRCDRTGRGATRSAPAGWPASDRRRRPRASPSPWPRAGRSPPRR